jgi:hypothetical protein
MLPVQSWIDSFHTCYNLVAIPTYQGMKNDIQFNQNIEKEFKFYVENFFLIDGTPKYYHNKTYPLDIHCPGQLFVNLSVNHQFEGNEEIANAVFDWVLT